MPTFFFLRSGTVIDTLKGADPQALNRLVLTHAGPNPPVKPLGERAEKAKGEGNEAFKKGEWERAVEKYTEAIEAAVSFSSSSSLPFSSHRTDSTSLLSQPHAFSLLTNRSLTYLKLSPPSFTLALADADAALSLSPSWAKAYVLKGEALEGLERLGKALKAYEEGAEKGTGTVKKEARERAFKVKRKIEAAAAAAAGTV